MTDLTDLFSRDPLTFSKEGGEVATIVARLRESRGQFVLGNKPERKSSSKAAKSESAVAKLGLKLNLETLLNKGGVPKNADKIAEASGAQPAVEDGAAGEEGQGPAEGKSGTETEG